jgi:hypothetical protein
MAGASAGPNGAVTAASTSSPPTSTSKPVTPEAPPEFFVTVYSQNPFRSVTALLGDTPPTPAAGGGGYEVVPIPGRAPIVVWRHADLYTLSLPIVIDNFVGGKSVADVVGVLALMWAGPDRTLPPPPVRLRARGWAVPFRSIEWVISDLTWGDAEANEHGNRTRQMLTLELTEFNAEQRLGPYFYPSPPKKRAAVHRKKHGTTPKSKRKVRVATGENLSIVAQRLGLAGGWQALGLAQSPPITDPRAVVVGQELRVPAGVLSTEPDDTA